MLFINADDYGLSRGINNGILECAKYGIVNGISIVPNGYAFNDGIKKIPSKKIKKISIHVNLVELFLKKLKLEKKVLVKKLIKIIL